MQRLEPVCLPPTAAELRHLCTGPWESACQRSPWRRAEVTREATERHANVQRMLKVDRDHFLFSKWKKKIKIFLVGAGSRREGEAGWEDENDICVNCLFW